MAGRSASVPSLIVELEKLNEGRRRLDRPARLRGAGLRQPLLAHHVDRHRRFQHRAHGRKRADDLDRRQHETIRLLAGVLRRQWPGDKNGGPQRGTATRPTMHRYHNLQAPQAQD